MLVRQILGKDVPRRSNAEAGFSLLELVIGLAVMVEVLVVVLILLDVNGRVARVQGEVADMQQSLRGGQHDMVRLVRMSGRGGVPQEFAVMSRQDVPADTKITTDTDAPTVIEGTDILTIRGVFSSPIYQVAFEDATTFVKDDTAKVGTLKIDSLTNVNIRQPLTALEEAVDAGGSTLPEALILVSSVDDAIYAIVELTNVVVADIADLDGDGVNERQATITFNYNPLSSTHAAQYLALSPGGTFPNNLTKVAFAGLVEEYRYYVREDHAIDGDTNSGLTPKLSRARTFPGMDVAYDTSTLDVEIASNIIDLQVAFGLDRGADGAVDENESDLTDDDWLFNVSGDDDSQATWNRSAVGNMVGYGAQLYYLRLSALARTERPDSRHVSQRILDVENRNYAEPKLPTGEAERHDRMFRRRLMRTVVDMRNVG